MVNHLDAVARRVRHENSSGLRIERAVVESAAYRARNVDDAHSVQRHGGLPPPCCRISETCMIKWSGGPFMRNLLERSSVAQSLDGAVSPGVCTFPEPST